MGFPVRVHGRTLVVQRPWSRRPTLLQDGSELPRNRWDTYVLLDEHGVEHLLTLDHTWLLNEPVVVSGAQRFPVLPALPRRVTVVLGAFVLLGLLGGVIGVVLSAAAAVVSAALLRRPGRRRVHVLGAWLAPLLAVTTCVLVGLLVR